MTVKHIVFNIVFKVPEFTELKGVFETAAAIEAAAKVRVVVFVDTHTKKYVGTDLNKGRGRRRKACICKGRKNPRGR